MAGGLLSHPFRITGNGAAAVLEDGTEEYLGERIALILTTEEGERPVVPGFGLGDLAYGDLTASALRSQCDLFGLPVDIISVEMHESSTDSNVKYTVIYDITGETFDEQQP